jgi:hypothetical protein
MNISNGGDRFLLRTTMPKCWSDFAGELACFLTKPAPVKDISHIRCEWDFVFTL